MPTLTQGEEYPHELEGLRSHGVKIIRTDFPDANYFTFTDAIEIAPIPGVINSLDVVMHIVGQNTSIAHITLNRYFPYSSDGNTGFNDSPITISRDDFLHLQQLEVQHEDSLGIFSDVTLENGETRHIPMMDLSSHLEVTDFNVLVQKIKGVLSRLPNIGDTLLIQSSPDSNKYHIIGTRLMTEQEQRLFLINWAMLNTTADANFIEEGLKQGHTCLRISDKWPNIHQIPFVIAIL